jgi:hypothetical protein
MSREEAEWLSAFHNPVSSSGLKDKIQKVVVGASPTPQADLFSGEASNGVPTKSNHYRSGSNSEEKFKISFSVGAKFMEKLLKAQELMFEGKADRLVSLCFESFDRFPVPQSSTTELGTINETFVL